MGLHEDWKKEIEGKLKCFDKEKIPAVIKRCPQCGNLSLEFDSKTGRIYCTRCGFEEHFPIMKSR